MSDVRLTVMYFSTDPLKKQVLFSLFLNYFAVRPFAQFFLSDLAALSIIRPTACPASPLISCAPAVHLAGKTGTTNNNVDTWFAGIDGSTVTITWVGRDNNQPTKLYGASGAMSIYQRYLANQTPTPLNLVPPEDIADMGVDYDGNFVCSGGMRVLPVWTSDPQSLCQQSEMQQQPSGNPFDQSSQPQQQPQQQPAQQEQKDSDGVAGWIKDMFGSN